MTVYKVWQVCPAKLNPSKHQQAHQNVISGQADYTPGLARPNKPQHRCSWPGPASKLYIQARPRPESGLRSWPEPSSRSIYNLKQELNCIAFSLAQLVCTWQLTWNCHCSVIPPLSTFSYDHYKIGPGRAPKSGPSIERAKIKCPSPAWVMKQKVQAEHP